MIPPTYTNRNFAHLPGLFHALLTGGDSPLRSALDGKLPQQVDQVIFLFVDAFGWRFFERFADHPALQRLAREGSAAQISSQFPSTTAAHMTTMTTGLPVGQHGIFEWQYYEPQVDAVIMPMMNSFAGDKWPETIKMAGIEAANFLPPRTLFQNLAAAGIVTHAILPKEVVPSTYNQVMSRGAAIHPYKTIPEALTNLSRLALTGRGPAIHLLYYGDHDSICHDYGPAADQTTAELDAFWHAVDRYFLRAAGGKLKNTLLLISADHGQTAVDPATTIYLNLHPDFPRLQPLLRRNARGKLLTPGGSPRDAFLYVNNGAVEEAQALLAAMLAGRADIHPTADLITAGMFGPGPLSPALPARLGDLCILPHAHETVWWYEKERFEQKFYGHHGGLSPDEIEIPLLALMF